METNLEWYEAQSAQAELTRALEYYYLPVYENELPELCMETNFQSF